MVPTLYLPLKIALQTMFQSTRVNWFCFQSKAVELNTFESIQPLQVQYCNQNPKNKKKKVAEKAWKKNTIQRITCNGKKKFLDTGDKDEKYTKLVDFPL